MYLIKSQVFFDDSWRELNNFQYGKVFYPVELSEKLSEELDSGEIDFYTDTEILYPQMTKFSVEIDVGSKKRKKFYFYGTDTFQKLNPKLFKHRVSLVEPTKDLEGVILDGLGFAQPEDNSARMTLYVITQRFLKCTPLRKQGQEQKYTLISEYDAPEIIALLKSQTVDEKLLPEFYWSSQTNMKEALVDIGAYCNLYPRLTLNPVTNEYTVITFDEVNKVKEVLESIGGITDISFQDSEQYCSELETNAQNVLARSEEANTIVYPSPTGWITPRTDEVRLTTDNARIELPFNINKIIKVYLCAEKLSFSLSTDSSPSWYKGDTAEGYFPFYDNIPFSECYDTKTNDKWDMSLDITYLVKEKTEFDTLKSVIDKDLDANDVYGSVNKANTMYYTKGTNAIIFGGIAKKYLSASVPNLVNLVIKYIKDFNDRAKTAYNGGDGNLEFDRKLYTYRNNGELKIYTSNGTSISYSKSNIITLFEDPREVKFRIEYEPLDTSSKFRVSKSLPVDKPFIQNFNQRAEINSAEALGRNMRGTVNRMGVPTENKLLIKPDLSEVPQIGDAYEKDGRTYIISQIDYNCFSMYQMAVNLTLSQDWNMLSQYVGIDRQFRWEQIYNKPVERNLFYQDYLVIVPYSSDNAGESIYLSDISKATDVLKSAYEEKTEINNCFLAAEEHKGEGVVLSVSSNAVGSSILFTAKTQDNLSAGKMIQENDDQYCVDAYYCKEDGTLGNVLIELGTDLEYIGPNMLPVSKWRYITAEDGTMAAEPVNFLYGRVASDIFYIDKNNSEQLNFVYELSFVSPCPYLIIGEGLAMNNPLIRQWNENRKFRFVRLKRRLPQGTVKVTENYIKSYGVTDGGASFFDINSPNALQTNLIITDNVNNLANDNEAVGWAITDENFTLLLASNDKSKTRLKIISSHEYHGKTWNL